MLIQLVKHDDNEYVVLAESGIRVYSYCSLHKGNTVYDGYCGRYQYTQGLHNHASPYKKDEANILFQCILPIERFTPRFTMGKALLNFLLPKVLTMRTNKDYILLCIQLHEFLIKESEHEQD